MSAGATEPAPAMGGSRSLAQNALWNISGLAAPVIAALVFLPVLLRGLGLEGFGLLSLVYVLIGYLGLFDFGLNRALTHLVAVGSGSGDEGATSAVIWSYVWLISLVGAVIGAALALAAPFFVLEVLRMSDAKADDAVLALRLVAVALPLSLSTAGLRGCLEGLQRFDLVTLVRLPSGIALLAAPAAVLPFRNDVAAATAAVLAVRVLTWVAHLMQCRRVVPGFRRVQPLRPRLLRPLLGFAGWITVSNTLAPLMAYLDRFLIGAVLSVSAVAVYATPYDVITKLTVVPLALTGVLFPAFARISASAPSAAAPLLDASLRWTLVVMFPPVAVAVALAEPALSVWVSSEFAEAAAPVLVVLALGVLFNGIAQVPLGLLQGMGRPRDPTLLQVAELVPYLVTLILVMPAHGIVGAAVVWSVRVAVDALGLTLLARRAVQSALLPSHTTTGVFVAAAAMLGGLVLLPEDVPMRAIGAAGAVVVFLLLAFQLLLTPEDRRVFRRPREDCQ